jgi:hypothetical protein
VSCSPALPTASSPSPLLHSTIFGAAGQSKVSIPEARGACLMAVDRQAEAAENHPGLRCTGPGLRSSGHL